jgi:hypothetical protein
VDLVLERLGPQQTRVGEWVNVLGYITSIHPSTNSRKPSDRGEPMVHVQALFIMSAGSLNMQQYEAVVDDLKPKRGGISGDNISPDTR